MGASPLCGRGKGFSTVITRASHGLDLVRLFERAPPEHKAGHDGGDGLLFGLKVANDD
jgi:hypothetical protein